MHVTLILMNIHQYQQLVISPSVAEYHPSNYQTGVTDANESVSDVIDALKHYMKDTGENGLDDDIDDDDGDSDSDDDDFDERFVDSLS